MKIIYSFFYMVIKILLKPNILLSICFVLFLLLPSTCVNAGTAYTNLKELTLKHALLIALSNQYDIIKSKAGIIQARSEKLDAIAGFLPELSIEDNPQFYQPVGKGGNTYIAGTLVSADQGFFYNSIGANFKWNVFNGGKNFYEYKAAEDDILSANQKEKSAISTAFADVLQAYTALAETQLDIDYEEKKINIMKSVSRLYKMRYKHSMISRIKYLEYQQKLLGVDNALQKKYLKFSSYKSKLIQSMGFSNSSSLRFDIFPSIPSINQPVDNYGSKFPLTSPSVIAALAAVKASREQVEIAKSNFWPTISITSQYNWLGLSDNRPGVAFLNTMGSNYTVGLSLKIPLLSALNVVASVQSAEAGVETAMGNYDRAISTVVGRRVQYEHGYRYLLRSLKITKNTLNLALEAQRLTDQRFSNGMTNKISVLKARIVVLDAENAIKNNELKRKFYRWMLFRDIDPANFPEMLLQSPG